MARNNVSLQFTVPDELLKAIERIPLNIKDKVLAKGVKQAAKPIAARQRELAPDSNETRSTDKQTSEVRAKFSKTKLKKEIKIVVRKGTHGFAAISGPTFPGGAKAHFDFGDKAYKSGRHHLLWPLDKDNLQKYEATPPYRVQKAENNFAKRAIDERNAEAVSILRRITEEAIRSGKVV